MGTLPITGVLARGLEATSALRTVGRTADMTAAAEPLARLSTAVRAAADTLSGTDSRAAEQLAASDRELTELIASAGTSPASASAAGFAWTATEQIDHIRAAARPAAVAGLRELSSQASNPGPLHSALDGVTELLSAAARVDDAARIPDESEARDGLIRMIGILDEQVAAADSRWTPEAATELADARDLLHYGARTAPEANADAEAFRESVQDALAGATEHLDAALVNLEQSARAAAR